MTIDDWDITPLNSPDYEFFNFQGREGIAIWTTSENVNYILATDPGGNTIIYTDESGDYVGTAYEIFPTTTQGSSAIWYNEDTEELCTAYQKNGYYGIIIDGVESVFETGANGHQFEIGSDYSFHVTYKFTDYNDINESTYLNYSCYSNGIWTNETIYTHNSYFNGGLTFDLKSDNTPYFVIAEMIDETTNATFINGVGGTSFSFNTDKYIGYGQFFLIDDEPYFVYPEIELNETVTGSLGQVTQTEIVREANLYGADSIGIASAIEYTFMADSIGRLHGFYSLYYPATDNYQLRYICKDGSTIYQQLLLVNDSKTFSIDTQSIFIDADGILRGVCLDMDTIVFYLYETQLSFGPPPPALAWTTASPPRSCYNNATYSYDFNVNRDSPVFSLDGNATWLNINETTGVLSGLATELGTYTVNITVAHGTDLLYYNYTISVVNAPGRFTLGQQISQYLYVLLIIMVALIFLAMLLFMDDRRSRW